jgi:hypothetical protein
MLTRLENAYLYILRVVVLAAATLALIAVVWALVRTGALAASTWTHPPESIQVPGGALQDYVEEKRPQGLEVQSSTPAVAPDVPAGIRSGIASLAHYARAKAGLTLNEAEMTSTIMDKRSELPADAQVKYESGFAALMDQLDKSTGTPLTSDQIGELIDWHLEKVKSNEENAAAQKLAAQTQAVQTLGIAGAGFGVFISLVFCFLIVKIERNLRLVRTEQVNVSTAA